MKPFEAKARAVAFKIANITPKWFAFSSTDRDAAIETIRLALVAAHKAGIAKGRRRCD